MPPSAPKRPLPTDRSLDGGGAQQSADASPWAREQSPLGSGEYRLSLLMRATLANGVHDRLAPLLLGSEPYASATAAARAQFALDEQWRDLSRSTDRDDATAAERDPSGARARPRPRAHTKHPGQPLEGPSYACHCERPGDAKRRDGGP